MRLLILGATGFVGRHLLAECRRRRDELVATYRPGEEIPESLETEWIPLDLLQSGTILEAVGLARADGVIHLAGQANVAQAHRDPIEAFRVNAEGTYRVLLALRELAPKTRSLIISSAAVYGAVAPAELPVRETRPMCPASPYGASKAAAEIAAVQAFEGWGLPVIRMRPFNHVGPGQRTGFVAPDFASQVARIERGEVEPQLRVGNLSARRDFTDVRDMVCGYRDALERGQPGAVYNLCSGVSVPIEEIVRFFVARSSVSIEIERDESRLRPADVPEFRGDPSAAERDFDWSPGVALEQSLAEVLEEWRADQEVAHPTD